MTMNTEKHHVTESATKFLSLFRLLSKVLGFSYGGQLRTRHIFIFQFCCFVIDGVDWHSQSRRGAKDSTDEKSAHANNNVTLVNLKHQRLSSKLHYAVKSILQSWLQLKLHCSLRLTLATVSCLQKILSINFRQNNRYNDAPRQSTQVVSEFPEYSTDS